MKKTLIRIAISLLLLITIVGIGFTVWATMNTYRPDTIALASWERAEKGDSWYAFYPPDGEATELGVIFYTGGLVDSRAYAHMMESLAEEAGVVVVVPDVPLNLVILNPTVADGAMADFPGVERWVLGGHSLGATGTAIYAHSHSDMAGLFFWAGGSWEPNDLSDASIPIISLHGSDDGIYTEEEWQSSRPFAPPDTEYITIQGANHSYFGNYGLQEGDSEGTTLRENAQTEIIEMTSRFLTKVKQ
jgi:hypothetical protein